MIKEKIFALPLNTPAQGFRAPADSGNTPTANPAGEPAASSVLSTEARGNEPANSRLGGLLSGLEAWGNEQPAQTPGTNGANQSNQSGWNDVIKSGQMPMSIIRQVYSTFTNAGGMATAGALHSLLSWGATEKQKTGQIRPEFQTILRDAIELAKKNRNISEEDLAKYEDRLFGDGQDKSAPGSKAPSDKISRIRDILAKRSSGSAT